MLDSSNNKFESKIHTKVSTTNYDNLTLDNTSESNGTDKKARKNIIPHAKSAMITTEKITEHATADQNNKSANSSKTLTSRITSKSQLSVPSVDTTKNKQTRRTKSAKTPRSSAKITAASSATSSSTRKKTKITKEDKERQKQRKSDLKKLK
jgi:hypothetical protein